ncbi:alpha/beta hydrolase [Streptomyces sp. SL13]|uniref:Alpha/beta hydrolase n=1 Tax=Streptantibioticus silvisoli TaxID=2705255 RepID=A0AA90KAU1_9ACTN|nr:alpha/beta hydrolase [Streptantibioticus silvisoli]MDI5963794.1 alpha/beta hydrolase [Streptantibioticus silvisoli]MDI5972823.1 alpha/beta hydrolase [Streptantibioticus silvisoli]
MASHSDDLTVVLIHGAFADAGSWAPVTERLVAAGVPVRAIANPLRGVAADSAYVAGVINQTPGRVLAVGHSYGGAVITNAVPQTDNVAGLVYVAAFAPDEGEKLGDIVAGSQDSALTSALQEEQYPTGQGSETATEVVIDPARFREVFTADLSQAQSDVYGLSQRPIAASAFAEVNGPAAWKKLPVWSAVGTGDKAAGADAVRSMARRAGADITEIDGSHVIMISQPKAVTDVILKAYEAVA